MKMQLPAWLKHLFGYRENKNSGNEPEFEAVDYIQHRLDLYIAEKKPFLQPRYTIGQLSEAIKVPVYQLSAIINLRKGMNFNDYVNRLRIRHCQQLIRISNGEKLSMRRLASGSGFHNRNTFTNAFKKFTGRTPSEYIRQQWGAG